MTPKTIRYPVREPMRPQFSTGNVVWLGGSPLKAQWRAFFHGHAERPKPIRWFDDGGAA